MTDQLSKNSMCNSVMFLLCDTIEKEHLNTYGDFDRMFHKTYFPDRKQERLPWLKEKVTAFCTYHVYEGGFPSEEELETVKLVIISGSQWGVYEEHDWIKKLLHLLDVLFRRNIAVIGICFGHQLLAQTLGGKVVKYKNGWHMGMIHYRSLLESNHVPLLKQSFVIPTIHQDQVIEIPKTAQSIITSDFCEYAGLVYPDMQCLSFQFHIEYPTPYLHWVILHYREKLYDKALGDKQAMTCFESDNDQHDGRYLANWSLQWLHQNHQKRA